MKVLLTGGSGFIGKHIIEECRNNGHEVLCIHHKDNSIEDIIKCFKPEILVHCAWGGVSASDRNNAIIQAENIKMSKRIISAYPYRQIICLGSQDEYGNISAPVNESFPLTPISEYAKAKIAVSEFLKGYAEEKGIEWQWLRLFNIYGVGQADNWLIPAIVKKCLNGEREMPATKGEQQYAYLNVKDVAKAIIRMFGQYGKSGIYNISAEKAITLKDIFLKIKALTNAEIVFQFGALPYRENQSMMICGDASKFKRTFGELETIDFDCGLQEVINSMKNDQKKHRRVCEEH